MHQMRRQERGGRTMFTNSSRRLRVLAAILLFACLCLPGPPAFGGMSQPGMILAGTVYDVQGALITQGKMMITFTPKNGGAALSLTASLGAVTGPYGMLSFAALVPLELAAPKSPLSGQALPVSSTPVAYIREISIVGAGIGRSDSVMVSTDDIGAALRVNLPKLEPSTEYHSGDVNQDGHFSLLELLREIELFTSTPDHSYHCDPLGEDGFDIGVGDQNCAPYSGDYLEQDWKFSLPELLRMIELYTSTGNHEYVADASSPDGFRPATPAATPAAKSAFSLEKSNEQPNRSDLVMRRTVKEVYNSSGTVLDVTIAFNAFDGQEVTSMGLEERLPSGWSFAGLMVGDLPAVQPLPDACGLLEFAWLPAPLDGGRFTYRVANRTGGASETPFAIYGEGLYRVRDVPDLVRVPVISEIEEAGGSGDSPVAVPIPVASPPQSANSILNAASSLPGLGEEGDGVSATAGGASDDAKDTDGLPLAQDPVVLSSVVALVALLAAGRIRKRAK